jgi:hypothetical protein
LGNCQSQFTLGAKAYADGPAGGPDWGIRFVIAPLFTTGAKPAAHSASAAR